MEMELKRVQRDPDVTVGELLIGGRHVCWICEDCVRAPDEPKVYGQTAIPAGRYEVKITHSPRFGVAMPLLLDVPGYAGVRIHPGNRPEDTEGCLLPGRLRLDRGVGESRLAYTELFAWIDTALQNGEEVWINITEPDLDSKVPPQAG